MLTKRVQILFDKNTYKTLEEIADEKKISVGSLVRTAVNKMYNSKSKTKKSNSLAEAAKSTFGAWKGTTLSRSKLVAPLAGPWSKPDEVFGK